MDFGIDIDVIRKKRRSFSRPCLDWSERQHHLAGALGEQIASRLFELEWIVRLPKTRAVKITDKGRAGFRDYFHLSV